MERYLRFVERSVIHVTQLLLSLVIILALAQLAYLFVIAVRDQVWGLINVPLLTAAVQRAFGGVLLIVLGLELLETLRVYFSQHRVRLEIILVVAMIAVARHVINLDLEHLSGTEIAGIGALVISLAGGYYLIRKAAPNPEA